MQYPIILFNKNDFFSNTSPFCNFNRKFPEIVIEQFDKRNHIYKKLWEMIAFILVYFFYWTAFFLLNIKFNAPWIPLNCSFNFEERRSNE